MAFSQGFQLATAREPLSNQIEAIHDLGSFGTKYIRYPIYLNFSEPLDTYINNLKIIIPIAKTYKMKVFVVLHNPWEIGDYSNIDYLKFKDNWIKLAKELGDYKIVFGIINEPKTRIASISTYKFYNEISRIIKRYSDNPIMFASFGVRTKELKYFKLEKINFRRKDWIEVHAYDYVNHLGYLSKKPNNKDFLTIDSNIKTFQNKYKARVIIGEVAFPAYHIDCDWYLGKFLRTIDTPFIIHAFRESDFWDYESSGCINTILNNFK